VSCVLPLWRDIRLGRGEEMRGLDLPNPSNRKWNPWGIWSLPTSCITSSHSDLPRRRLWFFTARGFHVNLVILSWLGIFLCYLYWLSHHLACYWSIPQMVACMDELAWEAYVFFGMLIWDDWIDILLSYCWVFCWLMHWITCACKIWSYMLF